MRRLAWSFGSVTAMALVLIAAWWLGGRVPPLPMAMEAARPPSAPGGGAAVPEAGPLRVAVGADATATPPTRPANGCADFASMFAGMTAVWQQAKQLAATDTEASDALQEEFEGKLSSLLGCHADAAERTLERLGRAIGAAIEVREAGLQCGGRILAHALGGAHTWFAESGERQRLDALVGQMLAVMGLDRALDHLLGRGLLDQRPYLGPTHEPALRELLVPKPDAAWLRPIAVDLLLTLWRNLVASGAMTQTEVDTLAMVLAGDPESPLYLAAILQLVQRGEGKHLHWLLEQVVATGDSRVMEEVAGAVASHESPETAVTALARLQAARPQVPFTAAWLSLAMRDAEVLDRCYLDLLASNADAACRAAILFAVGYAAPQSSLSVLELALESDPSDNVRGRALLAICATAAPARVSQALHTAMAGGNDGRPLVDPVELCAALESYAARNPDPPVVHELAHRLLAMGDLREAQRRSLRELLARQANPGK